ncbi:MAG: hypothetical protein KatS3mg033_1046 [Thermonema sp.]|jgi:outer membrane protein|uniref:OmpH family outer membrane protein n=1 Tax=Thermonema sp. TaxID=2231181 RepID=UPI0021DBEF3F|nr:OmpH family outer membrane protein [Thermonema sp.]GIV39246.1 MAG: hypothetical protein KatS3mg033_1046 [Thermonema sp.]
MVRLFCFLLFFACLHSAHAQKFGFVDVNFVLRKMPEYQQVQQDFDRFVQRATQEIEAKFQEVEELKRKYNSEELLLTEDMKRERLEEIAQKEKEARELQQKTFGYEGLIFLKKQELLTPLREKLNKALERVARQHQLQVIYDKSGDFVVVYLDPRHDYTDYVLEELGLGDPEDNPKENANR